MELRKPATQRRITVRSHPALALLAIAFAFPSSADQASNPAAVAVVPPATPVVDQAPTHWIRKYWEWSRSVAASAKPSADATGARCRERQTGPVWFLTGSDSPAAVVRTCEIPAGVHVLVPVVSTLVQPFPGQIDPPCKDLTMLLRGFGTDVTDLRLKVDGVALQNPAAYRVSTGCFELDDKSRKLNGLAAGDGYWVFLKPLPPGRHEVSFGGKFAGDGVTQNIKYLIDVR